MLAFSYALLNFFLFVVAVVVVVWAWRVPLIFRKVTPVTGHVSPSTASQPEVSVDQLRNGSQETILWTRVLPTFNLRRSHGMLIRPSCHRLLGMV